MTKTRKVVYVCYTIDSDGEYGYELKTNHVVFKHRIMAEQWVKEMTDAINQYGKYSDMLYQNTWATIKEKWGAKDFNELYKIWETDSNKARQAEQDKTSMFSEIERKLLVYRQNYAFYKDGILNEASVGARFDELEVIT